MSDRARRRLGKVFVSYSIKDRVFVQRLEEGLKDEGYSTWLFEHELRVGDAIPSTVSKAISDSKAVLVVMSPSSVKSKWVKFELNHATEAMIRGKTRLIPVIRGRVQPPSEIEGILYADFRRSFAVGLKKVMDALEYECKRLAPRNFWEWSRDALESEFSTGFSSSLHEYKSIDYDFVCVEVEKDGKKLEANAVYEVVSDYAEKEKPLGDNWWAEFLEAIERFQENYALIISERPIGLDIERIQGLDPRIGIRREKHPEVFAVLIDLSGKLKDESKQALLAQANQVLQNQLLSV